MNWVVDLTFNLLKSITLKFNILYPTLLAIGIVSIAFAFCTCMHYRVKCGELKNLRYKPLNYR